MVTQNLTKKSWTYFQDHRGVNVRGIQNFLPKNVQKFRPILRASKVWYTTFLEGQKSPTLKKNDHGWLRHSWYKLRWCLWLVGICINICIYMWYIYIYVILLWFYSGMALFPKIMLFHYQYSPRVQYVPIYFKIIAIAISCTKNKQKHIGYIYISQKHRWHHLTI